MYKTNVQHGQRFYNFSILALSLSLSLSEKKNFSKVAPRCCSHVLRGISTEHSSCVVMFQSTLTGS